MWQFGSIEVLVMSCSASQADTLCTGRECVAPEVNRNYNIGEKGVNMNSQVFQQYLTQMSFNQELVRAIPNHRVCTLGTADQIEMLHLVCCCHTSCTLAQQLQQCY